MFKLLFTPLIDAALNRVGGVFANVFLRRLATHAAAAEAMEIAAIEEHIAMLRHEGRDFAADRLALHLEEAKGDDPSYAIATCFGRQLLADSYVVDTPELRGEPVPEDTPVKPRRVKGAMNNGRLADRPL